MFVDSDDAISQNTLETYYENARLPPSTQYNFHLRETRMILGKTTEYSLRFYLRRIMHVRGK